MTDNANNTLRAKFIDIASVMLETNGLFVNLLLDNEIGEAEASVISRALIDITKALGKFSDTLK